MIDILDRVYLNQYLDDLSKVKTPKKCIIFCRGNGLIGALYGRLMGRTDFKYSDCRNSPFVMNLSLLLPPTEKVLTEREGDISLYLSSNKMLLGIDLPDIDVIIFVRPYNQVAALVQGGERGGRKLGTGQRRCVQVYQFYNNQDFSSQNMLMSEDMRRICRSEECTIILLQNFFVGDVQDKDRVVRSGHCCHNCNKLLNIKETVN